MKNLVVIHGLTETDGDSRVFLVCRTNLHKGEVKAILKQHLNTTNDWYFTRFRHSGVEIIRNYIDIDLGECI